MKESVGWCVKEVTIALELDPSVLQKIVGKAADARRAAEAAKKARELVRTKSLLTKSTLPGVLPPLWILALVHVTFPSRQIG